MNAPSGRAVSVDFATADVTATAGSDYLATNGTLNFVAGETSKQVTVIVNGDQLDEANETFALNLTNAANATTTRIGPHHLGRQEIILGFIGLPN